MKQGINISVIVTAGAIGILMVVIILLGVEAWLGYELRRETSLKWDNAPIQPLTSEKEAATTRISSYRWVDREKQTVAIPVTEAMRILIATKGNLPATRPAATRTAGATN